MEGNLPIPIVYEGPNLNLTCGSFEIETTAQEWLVSFLRSCRGQDGRAFFKVVEEQRPGKPIYRHHRQEELDKKNYRCDVIALPLQRQVSEIFGAMVFDVKKSNIPIGKGISQLRDYLASVFDVAGIQVVPSFGFLFPCRKQKCATASWMQHQSMGSVHQEEHNRHVVFYSGEERLIEFDEWGNIQFITRSPKSGRGSGCR